MNEPCGHMGFVAFYCRTTQIYFHCLPSLLLLSSSSGRLHVISQSGANAHLPSNIDSIEQLLACCALHGRRGKGGEALIGFSYLIAVHDTVQLACRECVCGPEMHGPFVSDGYSILRLGNWTASMSGSPVDEVGNRTDR